MTTITISTLMMMSILIMLITILLSQKSTSDQEKLSPFECGFNPSSSPRIPFSIRFFLIAMIFLIFDVEIVLLIPVPLFTSSMTTVLLTSITFIIILMMGLFHEWKNGVLNWMK